MKVCLLNDSFPPVIDGVANVVLNYAGIMQTKGLADVCVATPKYPDTDYSVYPYKVYPYHSFDTTGIVKGYRAGNPLDLKEIGELADFEPDIIHTHCPVASSYVGRTLRAKTDAPLIFTYHTKFDEDIARAVKAEFLRKETIRVLVNNIEASDEVWVVSRGAGENLRSLGFEGDYRVVSNGVDFAKGKVSTQKVKEVTSGYDLPEGIPVFLFVGRIIEYKGIPIILDALARLSEQGRDFRMVFVGKGPDEEKMKQKAKDLGLLDNADETHPGKCIFTGAIYDRDILRAWNTRSDLFLFPSTYDTNGIVVREAAACGLASVLVEGSCAAEGITDGRNGFFVQQNSDSIATLLGAVMGDLDHLHDVGMHAMDEIYISWEDSVYAAHQRYGEIIDLKASGKLKLKTNSFAEYVWTLPDEIEDNMREFDQWRQDVKDELKEMQQGFQENIREVRDDVKEFGDGVKDEIRGIREEMKEELRSFTSEVKDEIHEFRSEVKGELDDLRKGIRGGEEDDHSTNNSEKTENTGNTDEAGETGDENLGDKQ